MRQDSTRTLWDIHAMEYTIARTHEKESKASTPNWVHATNINIGRVSDLIGEGQTRCR